MSWFFSSKKKRERVQAVAAPAAQDYQPVLPSIQGERRYRNDVPYVLPKDLDEVNRLDFQHYALRAVLKGNYLAPLQNPRTILDIGCGTGIWGYEMAREFPQAQIYGLDLEIVTKPDAPANTHFVPGNVLQGLPFQANQFDFVHQRLLVGALPATAWPVELQQIFRVLRPGGWVELLETNGDYTTPVTPANRELADGIIKIAALRGIDTRIIGTLDSMLAQIGFQHIEKRVLDIPMGQWADRLGSLMSLDWQSIVRAFQPAFISILGYTPARFEQLFAEMVKEWEQYHSHSTFHVLYAQKGI